MSAADISILAMRKNWTIESQSNLEPLLTPRQQVDLAKDHAYKFTEEYLDRKDFKHAYLLARKLRHDYMLYYNRAISIDDCQ